MRRNLEMTKGLVYSGQLRPTWLRPMLREEARKLVQEHATRAWREEWTFAP
jgi:adenylosuccinate lyase